MAEGKDKFDINNDQKLKQDNLDKSDGPIAKTEILDGQPEHGIHDTEERADADFRPGNENFDINNDQKIAFDKSDGPIAKTEILDGQPEQGILGQANGAPNVSGDVAGDNLRSDHIGMLKVSDDMVDMNTHMDDAAAHQASSEGPPQDPQGMGLDRLGTQFDEDGMGDMHKPDDPNDGGEVV